MAISLDLLKNQFICATGILPSSQWFEDQFTDWLKKYEKAKEIYYNFLLKEKLIESKESTFELSETVMTFKNYLNNIEQLDPHISTLLMTNPYYISSLNSIENVFYQAKKPMVLGIFGNNEDINAESKLENLSLWASCFAQGDSEFWISEGMYFCAFPNKAARTRSKGA